MYFLFRHLIYLSVFACAGLFVLGFAFEKLPDDTTAVAFLSFSAFIVHLAAFWFVMAPTSPIRNAISCIVVMAGCLAAVALGRWLQVILSEGAIDQWWSNVVFISQAIPAWWLLLVVETIIVKELFRWRLHAKDQLLTQQLSIIELFGMTTALGIALGFSSSTLLYLLNSQYIWIGVLSSFVHIAICLPFAYTILTKSKDSGSNLVLGFCTFVGVALLCVASFRFLSGNLHSFSDIAIGLASFAGPFVLAMMFAREKHMHIVSDWQGAWSRESTAEDHSLLE